VEFADDGGVVCVRCERVADGRVWHGDAASRAAAGRSAAAPAGSRVASKMRETATSFVRRVRRRCSGFPTTTVTRQWTPPTPSRTLPVTSRTPRYRRERPPERRRFPLVPCRVRPHQLSRRLLMVEHRRGARRRYP
jgi:hypothetical protein